MQRVTWRAPVYHVVDDEASSGSLCGGCRGEHLFTMWWLAWRAPVHYVVDDAPSTCHYAVDDAASTCSLCGG
jgi:hypothetical protein